MFDQAGLRQINQRGAVLRREKARTNHVPKSNPKILA
jgi:hypothetical protein